MAPMLQRTFAARCLLYLSIYLSIAAVIATIVFSLLFFFRFNLFIYLARPRDIGLGNQSDINPSGKTRESF